MLTETRKPFGSEVRDRRLLARAVEHAKRGECAAVHFLYVRYADEVYDHVLSVVPDPHEAEDVTQNVFAQLMPAIRKYEQRKAPFAAWILGVAHDAAHDHLRQTRHVPVQEVRGSS